MCENITINNNINNDSNNNKNTSDDISSISNNNNNNKNNTISNISEIKPEAEAKIPFVTENEEVETKDENLLKSQANNFNSGRSPSKIILSNINVNKNNTSASNVNNNSINMSKSINLSLANSLYKKLSSEQTEASNEGVNNTSNNNYNNNTSLSTSFSNFNNKTFCNIASQIKTSLDFSQIKADKDNTILMSNNNTTNKKDYINNINVLRIKSLDSELRAEEELINQKNTKIMLNSKA